MKTWFQHIMFLSNNQQKIVAECVVKVKMLMQNVKLNISLVLKILGVCFRSKLVHYLRVMNQPMSQVDKGRNRTSEIHQGVYLYRFTLLKLICIIKRHNLCKYCFSFVHRLQDWLYMPIYKTTSSNRENLLIL